MADLTWRGAPLPEKTRTNYINLKTKRIITNLNRRDLSFIDLSQILPGGVEGSGPFIAGPPEIIEEFYNENHDRLMSPASESKPLQPPRASIQLPGELPSLPPASGQMPVPGGPPLSGVRLALPPLLRQPPHLALPVPPGRSGVVSPLPPRLSPPVPPVRSGVVASPSRPPVLPIAVRPGKPIIMPVVPLHPTCPAVGGSSIGAPRTTSVRDLSDELIGRLCPFHLTGVTGEGKVTRIIDGDTIELLVYVPLKEIGRLQPMGRRKIPLAAALVTASSPSNGASLDEGFFTILKCRLDGVDFAEKNTLQGREGTRLMTELYAESKNYVHYIIGKQDKYGRYLVRLYNHPNRHPESYLNSRYVDVETSVGVVAVSYGGGTKCEYMKRLPRLDRRGLGAVEEELVCESLDPDEEFYGLEDEADI